MRDGSFDPDLQGIEFEEDFEIKRTALPSEVPARPNLNFLTESVGKSGALDALMSQNEDLMSRLGIALRRVAQLEDRISSTQTENDFLKAKHEDLVDQVLVFKEKARLMAERKSENQDDVQNLKKKIQGLNEQIQLLEIRYSELYQTLLAKESRWVNDSQKTTQANARLMRYRERVKRITRGMQSRYKEVFQAQKKLSQRLADKETLFETVKSNLLQAGEQLQTQKSTFETELQQKQAYIAQLSDRLNKMEASQESFDRLAQEKVELENQLILEQRKLADFQLAKDTETTDLQSSLARYRNEAKELALELQNRTEEVSEKDLIQAQLNKENFGLREQVENLQILWKEQQRKLEKFVEKNVSLQKLNQELSAAINQHRRDLRDARERLDANQIQATVTEVSDADANKRPELLDKIDKALGQLL